MLQTIYTEMFGLAIEADVHTLPETATDPAEWSLESLSVEMEDEEEFSLWFDDIDPSEIGEGKEIPTCVYALIADNL
jgi:hypothetical protein